MGGVEVGVGVAAATNTTNDNNAIIRGPSREQVSGPVPRTSGPAPLGLLQQPPIWSPIRSANERA